MDFFVVSIVSVLILALFVSILLFNSKTSNNIKLEGNILTVWHPLKKEMIDLENDLKSWKVRRMNLLWRGKLYVLSMELKDGAWKKIYFRSRTKKVKLLIATLEDLAPEGRLQKSTSLF